MQSTLDSKFKSVLQLFIQGFITPFKALEFIIHHPKLLTLSVFPILTAIISLSVLIYLLLTGAWSFAHAAFLSAISSYSGIVFVLVSLLLLAALSSFAVSLITFLVSFFASPVNDLLAEHTEKSMGIQNVPGFNMGRLFRIVWLDLKKTVITVLGALTFGLGMLLPGANIGFFLGLCLLDAFTFISYPLSRREQGIISSIVWIKQNFFLSLGFGMATLFIFSIPVVNFFALPISVVGGTMLYCQTIQTR